VGEPAHEALQSEAQQLVAEMQYAYNKGAKFQFFFLFSCLSDVEANEQGTPATARQQLAPRVQSCMARAYLGPQLIEAGLLSALSDWLKPLPNDGAPPSASVKRTTLAGLLSLTVDWGEGSALNALKKSGLGRHVMQMLKNERLPELTAAAEKLVELWSRPVFAINDDYRTLTAVDERRAAIAGLVSASGPSGASKSLLAAKRQQEIQERVEASRKKPNTRAQLPYAGAELGQAVRRPGRKGAAPEGQQRASETAQQLLAGIQLHEEVAREVSKAGTRLALRK
jgi:hypothetical protein